MAVGLYTLDVGHGLCQIILFPNRKAIVIDGGDYFAADTVMEFLDLYVDKILAYILTHNDKDHVGAALQFLTHKKFSTADTLNAIYGIVDRGSASPVPFIDYALRRYDAGTVRSFTYGCTTDGPEGLQPRVIYNDPAEEVIVEVLYPGMVENIPAFRVRKKNAKKQNRTCMCLRLTVGVNTALITGDIDLIGLTRIISSYGFDVRADVMTVPHHGGQLPSNADCLTWNQILARVDPKVAMVSCGYRGGGRQSILHLPTFQGLVDRKAAVICTELTSACSPDSQKLAPGLMQWDLNTVPQLSHRLSPDAVACMGSIVAVFTKDSFHIENHNLHSSAVNELCDNTKAPLCRQRATAQCL